MLQGVTKSRRTTTTLTVDAAITVAVEKRVVVRTGTTVGHHYWRRRLSILQTRYWWTTGRRLTLRMPLSRPRWRHFRPEATLLSGAWCNRRPTCWPRTCALKSDWSNSMPPPRMVPRQS